MTRLGLASVLLGLSFPANAASGGWQTAGTIGEIGLVSVALGKTIAAHDREGLRQLGFNMGTTVTTTEVLKRAIGAERPNGRNNRSFPSGHTSISFSAAGHLHARYRWEWGAPALAFATFVGLSRVEAREHRWEDVIAGALLGTVSAHVFSTPYDDRVRLVPWGDTKGGGMTARVVF